MGYWQTIARGDSNDIPNVVSGGTGLYRVIFTLPETIPDWAASQLDRFGLIEVVGRQIRFTYEGMSSSLRSVIEPILAFIFNLPFVDDSDVIGIVYQWWRDSSGGDDYSDVVDAALGMGGIFIVGAIGVGVLYFVTRR